MKKGKLLALAIAGVLACTCLAVGCTPSGDGGHEDTGKEEEMPDRNPEKNPEQEQERKLRDLPADFKYEVNTYEYTVSYDDITLYGRMYEPSGLSGKYPAVIMSHGFNGHYTDFPAECERLAQRGYLAYAFDFCGAQNGGKSTGRTAQDYTPFTMKEDLRAVVNDLMKNPDVDPTQIFLWGGSQGGFVTSLVASDADMKDKIAAVALYFPALNIPDDWRDKPIQDTPLMGYSIGAKFIESIRELDPFEVIGAYEGDVCIVWGDQDALVARKYIDGAMEAYGERAELTVLPGAGHGFGGADLTKAIDTVLSFLEARTYEP